MTGMSIDDIRSNINEITNFNWGHVHDTTLTTRVRMT